MKRLLSLIGNLDFHTKFPQRSGGLRNFEEFGFSVLEFSHKISFVGGGKYYLSLVTIVVKVNH